MNSMLQKTPSDGQQPTMPPNYPVILYLKQKSGLSESDIRQKLLKGLTFQIKGQGNELDSRLIQDVLIQNEFYEKATQKQLKDQALRFVKNVVEQWSLAIAKEEKKINREELPNYTAKILAFGSYVLDLRSNSSDIDLVCVVPNFVNRQTHFFEGLASKLQQQVQVKGLTKVRSKKAPIITFDYKQINIDIGFCKLQEQTVPRDIERVLNMDKINKIKEQQSKNAIMGRKNNLMILQLVGAGQLQNFKQTLRLIKVWSKNRGISSNVMGYLGGISWAIMLAKICQIFPYHRPSKLIAQFFNIYKLWRFKQMPIILIDPTKQNLQIAQANQKSTTMMSVYTPGDHYNSTQKVNRITFDAIQREISRGCQILMYNRTDFQSLCQKYDFVNSYPLFIEIDVCGLNQTKQQQKDYKHFIGSVQSKILSLLSTIIKYNNKDLENKTLKIVPNPKSYKKTDPNYELCNSFFLGVHVSGDVDLNKAVSEWCVNLDKQRNGKQEYLNVRLFECFKEDFITDVQVQEVQKKVEKEDPRLAMRARKG